jgi:hypothetical protein
MDKREKQVGVRVSERDLKLLRKAAQTQWPGIPVTNSTLLLTLAKLKATEILKARKKAR